MPRVEYSSQSFVGRACNSLGGAIFGVFLGIGAVILLAWNEGNGVANDKATSFARDNVKNVPCDVLFTTNEGQLISATGCKISGFQHFSDQFGFNASNILAYSQTVEMYQWQEQKTQSSRTTKDSIGGGTHTETITEYSYSKVWSSNYIDSSVFNRDSTDHTNTCYASNGYNECVNPTPNIPLHSSQIISANNVHLGVFFLSAGQTAAVANDPAPFTINPPPTLTLQAHNNVLYQPCAIANCGYGASQVCCSPGTMQQCTFNIPCVGDIRIIYNAYTARTGSFLGSQNGNQIAGYANKAIGTKRIGPFVQEGSVTATTFLDQKAASDKALLIGMRILGFFMLWLGAYLVCGPLVLAPDLIPCIGPLIGDFVGGIVCIATFIVAGIQALFVIALAWIFYRPIIGVPLLVSSVLLCAGLAFFQQKRKRMIHTNYVSQSDYLEKGLY